MAFSRRCEVRGLPGKFLVVRESYLNWRVVPDNGNGQPAGPKIKVAAKDIAKVEALRVRPKRADDAGRPYAGKSYPYTVEIEGQLGRFFVIKYGKKNSRVIVRDPETKVAIGESFVVPNLLLKNERAEFKNFEGEGTIGPHGEVVLSAPLRAERGWEAGAKVIMTLAGDGILVRLKQGA